MYDSGEQLRLCKDEADVVKRRLATRGILETTNKWRRERGATEISLNLIDGELEGNGP